jgi:hypothetical protein
MAIAFDLADWIGKGAVKMIILQCQQTAENAGDNRAGNLRVGDVAPVIADGLREFAMR